MKLEAPCRLQLRASLLMLGEYSSSLQQALTSATSWNQQQFGPENNRCQSSTSAEIPGNEFSISQCMWSTPGRAVITFRTSEYITTSTSLCWLSLLPSPSPVDNATSTAPCVAPPLLLYSTVIWLRAMAKLLLRLVVILSWLKRPSACFLTCSWRRHPQEARNLILPWRASSTTRHTWSLLELDMWIQYG
jgi:hypothetical protein